METNRWAAKTMPADSEGIKVHRVVHKSPSLDNVPELQDSIGCDGDVEISGRWFAAHIEHPIGAPRPPVVTATTPQIEMRRAASISKVEEVASRFTTAGSRLVPSASQPNMHTNKLLDSPPQVKNHQIAMERQAATTCCSSSCAALRKLLCRNDASRTMAAGLPYDSADSAVVIFDWDDTLFPTSFIMQAVLPEVHQAEQENPLTPDSRFYNDLENHAHLVEFVLTKAREVARVAIVTLSMSPWVEASAERYLPGLDMKRLMQELDIPVYYSRGHVHQQATRWQATLDRSKVPGAQVGMDVDLLEGGCLLVRNIAPSGAASKWNSEHPGKEIAKGDQITSVNGQSKKLVNVCRREQVLDMSMIRTEMDPHALVEAKSKDMTSVLDRFYKGDVAWHKNVLSIGDSITEQQALKELLLTSPPPLNDESPFKANAKSTPKKNHEPLCKTVNLLCMPSLDQLGNELRILMVWLPRMVSYNNTFDLDMDGLDALERELFEHEKKRKKTM